MDNGRLLNYLINDVDYGQNGGRCIFYGELVGILSIGGSIGAIATRRLDYGANILDLEGSGEDFLVVGQRRCGLYTKDLGL